MEIKIPKEVRRHKETIFFGLSTRQFLCALLAVCAAVGVYFALKDTVGRDGKLGLHFGRSATRSRRLLSVQRPDAGSLSMGRH